MKIKAGDNGEILAWGEEVKGQEFTGDLPEDFDATAALGKYLFQDGEIVAVPEWQAPPPPPEPFMGDEMPPEAEQNP